MELEMEMGLELELYMLKAEEMVTVKKKEMVMVKKKGMAMVMAKEMVMGEDNMGVQNSPYNLAYFDVNTCTHSTMEVDK